MKRIAAKTRVAAGIKFLSRHFRNRKKWMRKIDPSTLRLSSLCNCVLGQTKGNYYSACELLKLSDQQTYELGFVAYWFKGTGTSFDNDCTRLEREWAKQITEALK